MKVYIILDESNSLGLGALIEKVFDTEKKALDHIINNHFHSAFYQNMSDAQLRDNAKPFVFEMEVE